MDIMDINSLSGYNYASLDEIDKNLFENYKKKKKVRFACDDLIEDALKYTTEHFSNDEENQSITKNEEPTITPLPTLDAEIITVPVVTKHEILRNFWENNKLWLIIAILTVVCIIFMIIYTFMSGELFKPPPPQINLVSSHQNALDPLVIRATSASSTQ